METIFEATEFLLSEYSTHDKSIRIHMPRPNTIRDIATLCIIMIVLLKDFLVANKLYVKRLANIKCEFNNVRSYLNYIGGDYRTSVSLLLESPDKMDIFELV